MPADLHDVPRLLEAISGVAARAAAVVADPQLRQQLAATVTVLGDLAGSVDWGELSRSGDRRVLESVAGVVPGVEGAGAMAADDLLREISSGIAALVAASAAPDDPQVISVGQALLAAHGAEGESA